MVFNWEKPMQQKPIHIIICAISFQTSNLQQLYRRLARNHRQAAVRRRLIQEVKESLATHPPLAPLVEHFSRTILCQVGFWKNGGHRMSRVRCLRLLQKVWDANFHRNNLPRKLFASVLYQGDKSIQSRGQAVSVSRTCCHGAYEQLDLLGMLKDLQQLSLHWWSRPSKCTKSNNWPTTRWKNASPMRM